MFIKAILVPDGTKLPSREMFDRARSLVNDLVMRPAVFFLPAGQDHLLYSPTQRTLMLCSKEARMFLRNYHKHQPNLSGSEREMEKFFAYFGILAPRALFAQPKKRQKGLPKYEPTIATLFLTAKCNLRCRYCYSNAGIRGKSLAPEAGKAVIDLIIDNAVRTGSKFVSIAFHGGGEPTLEWGLLKQMVEYANDKSKINKLFREYACNTNGQLIDKEKAEFFRSNGFHVTVSLDGFRNIHDYQRPAFSGTGSYDRAVRAVRLLNQQGVNPEIRITITKINYGQIVPFIKYLTSTFQLSSVSLATIRKCGRGSNHQEGLSLRQIIELEKKIDRFKGPVKIVTEPSLLINEVAGDRACLFYDHLFLTSQGNISACPLVNEVAGKTNKFIIGRYNRRENKMEIFEDKRRKLFKRSVEKMKECQGCFAKYNCRGGCPVACELNQGDMMKPMEKECAIKRGVLRERFIELVKTADYKINKEMLAGLLKNIPALRSAGRRNGL